MRITRGVRLLFDVAAELLAPTGCAACDEGVAASALFCETCRASVDRSLDRAAVFSYGGAVATAIARLKYRGRPDLGSRMGELLAVRAPRDVDVVVPVPLHPRRLAERGYNQAALMAAVVARRLGIAHAPRALDRVRDTPRQADLDKHERAANVEGAFTCLEQRPIDGRRVLLVDDVRTTGATLGAAAATLRAKGARAVSFVTFAARDREEQLASRGTSGGEE